MSSVHDGDEAPPPAPVPVQASRSGVLVLNVYSEYPAVANGADRHGFAVMVHLKAPALVTAATLDLVVVLDVSGSMAGAKLAQVKRAMGFIVDRLGPRDRLGVDVFSGDARRQVIPRMRMTDDGKAAAKLAVEALETSMTASTNVRAALHEAANAHSVAGHWNDVRGVILVSDGHGSRVVPELSRTTPVHTFGLGSDLDAVAMYNISEATGGTFSFVEDHAALQDALARCIGGLRSVTARDVYLEINCAEGYVCDDVKVTAVKSGRSKTSIIGRPSRNKAVIEVDELYADEERRILLILDIPRVDDERCISTDLIYVDHCSYTDVSSGLNMKLPRWEEYVERPVTVTATDVARCVEVERELLRVAAAEDMALAREAAERGAYDEAARILDARRESLSRSAPAQAGDTMCTAVAAELHELSQRVSDEREYKKTGRACILASMSSHGLQRGSSSSLQIGCEGSSVFATPAMRKMAKLSEMMRKQQEMLPRPPLPANGSKTGVALGSRRRLQIRLASAALRLSLLGKYRRLLLKR